ncbi:MAG: TlpA family protein disulfide reductase [Planctomycetes bacterium]|nr:TlpA family protein disulfide reductase [Planctomycetota bacterium]
MSWQSLLPSWQGILVIGCICCCGNIRADEPLSIPPVELSAGHAAMCKVKVGDKLPSMELPQLDGRRTKLSDRFGEKATVVLFWKDDQWMSQMAIADMARDVTERFGSQGVAVVGIAVQGTAAKVSETLAGLGAGFASLLDADGKVFAEVGSEKLPRVYLVGSQGDILWFDIEYSHATRRELNQSLRAVVGESASAGEKQDGNQE